MHLHFLSKLRNLVSPPRVADVLTRRFDGAAGGRRSYGFGTFGRTQTEVSAAAHIIRSRARHLATNNPLISNAVANWTAALVGTGIVPTADVAAAAAFNGWAEAADADQRTDFWGLQADIARALVVDGEAFVQTMTTELGLRLRLLPAELVDEAKTLELAGGGYTVNGVEFDVDGVRVAYHVLPVRPTDPFAHYAAPARIPASEILHVFKPLGIGQVRGISWLAPLILPANEFDQLIDALLVGTKVAAMHAGFLIDQNGTGEPYDGTGANGIMETGLEPGTLKRLPTGFDIKFNSPQQAQQTAEFMKAQVRQLAAGLGLPSHYLDGDLTGANYSSLRAGLLPFRQRVEQIQYHTLVPQLLNPVWQRVLGFALLTGEIDTVPRAEWLPPAWQQVDPEKAVAADIAELNAGLTSRKKLVAQRGWDADTLDSEIADDRAREGKLGLEFAATSKKENSNAGA